MKTKKVLCILCAIGLLFNFGTTAGATDAANNNSSTTLYVSSVQCPQDYINFVSENVGSYLQFHQEDPTMLDISTITIGTPFAFINAPDVFYFPILENGIPSYMFRVYPNIITDGFCGVMSAAFVDNLLSLAPTTSEDTPAIFSSNGTTLIATIDEENIEFYDYGERLASEVVSSDRVAIAGTNDSTGTTNSNELKLIDVFEDSGIRFSIPPQPKTLTYRIELNISETQGNNSWCVAYCGAALMRTLRPSSFNNVTAYTIMQYYYGVSPSSSLSATFLQIQEYANGRGFSTRVSYSPLSNSSLISELAGGRPVGLLLNNLGSRGGSHAVVLRAYDPDLSKWSIWNPWFSFYETFDIGGTYVPFGYQSTTDNYTYTTQGTIYNWTK